MDVRPVSAGRFPWVLSLVVGLLLAALGLKLSPVLSPFFLAAFIIYVLLPYRTEPWVFRTLVVVLVGTLLWLVSQFGWILLVLGISLFLAYLLSPAVRKLERRRVNRSLGIMILLVPVMALVVLGGVLLVPPVVDEVGDAIDALPELEQKARVALEPVLARLQLDELADRYGEQIPKAVAKVNEILLKGVSGVVGVTKVAGSFLAALLLIPFCTFFFVRDFDRVKERGEELVPRKYHPWVRSCAEEMDRLLGQWLRGLALVALIVGVLTWLGLFLLGVPYALALGVLAGLLNFVPVLGFWISLLAATLVALASAGWIALVKVLALYLVLSVFEGQVLQPRVVGEAVGLHPVVILLALIVFSDLFGLLGAFVAVPLSIFLAILGRQARALYLASDLYEEPSPPSTA